MQSARYFRARALLCLEIARHIGDAESATNLRANAAAHFSRAIELERLEEAEEEKGWDRSSPPRMSAEK
jgi:hypothetical protein